MKTGKFVHLAGLLCLSTFMQANAAQSGSGFDNVDLTATSCCSSLSLQDVHGVRRQLNDFRGKVVVIAFGFTNCPDVCPTTLHELAQSMTLLKEQSKEVQVLFVTLDPARDSAKLLSQYVPAFDPSFIALRGSAEETAKTARDFRVFYAKVPGKTATTYTMDHTVGVYLVDRSGRPRVFARSSEPKILLPDIQRLLLSKSSP